MDSEEDGKGGKKHKEEEKKPRGDG